MLVFYASMSGNGEWVAELVCAQLRAAHGQAEVQATYADAVSLERLRQAGVVIAVMSTWGQGELPADAEPLARAIEATSADGLGDVQFAMIALGDKRYPKFCAGGLQFADLLARRGARELCPPLLLDGGPVEKYAEEIKAWVDGVVRTTHSAAVSSVK